MLRIRAVADDGETYFVSLHRGWLVCESPSPVRLSCRDIVSVVTDSSSIVVVTVQQKALASMQLRCGQSPCTITPHHFRLAGTTTNTATEMDPDAFVRQVRLASGLNAEAKTRRWLAIVNGSSGNGAALKMVDAYLCPIVSAGGDELYIRKTEHSDHARTFASTLGGHDASEIYGLISCGGDGLLHEIINGNLAGANLPVAVLPGGTDNSLSVSLNIRSAFHAAMAILKGKLVGADLCSVHELSASDSSWPEPLTYAHTTAYVGFMSAVLKDMEDNRWLGPSRAPLCGIRHAIRSPKDYQIQVCWRRQQRAYVSCSRPKGEPCMICDRYASNEQEGEGPVQLASSPDGVHCVMVGCHTAKSHAVQPTGGMWPSGHFSDGSLDVILMPKFSWLNFLTFIWKVSSDSTHVKMPGVEYVKASEVVLALPPGSDLCFGVDGEVLPVSSGRIGCRVHPSLLRVMAASPEMRTISPDVVSGFTMVRCAMRASTNLNA